MTVLEASPHLGGKLRVSDLAGVPVDEGAEALLLRRPEAVDLATAVGLGPDLEDAATTSAAVWSRGAMRPLPRRMVMGVPADLRDLAATGLLTRPELARVVLDRLRPGATIADDVSVGHYVAARMGRAVVDRLVEPLLGGVYAGRAGELSLHATMPQLAPYVVGRSLLAAASASRAASDRARPTTSTPGAVFGAPRGGVGRLPGALVTSLKQAGVTIRTDVTVRELARTSTGWRLVVGSTAAPEEVLADAVVVAVPAAPAARLLAGTESAAAAELAQVPYSSMAVVALAVPRGALPTLPKGSGFLVPPVEGRSIKAVTLTSAKWGWYADVAPDLVLLRASVGRLGEEALLQRDDAELVDQVRADLADAIGLRGSPVASRVTRWGGGLPQYTVGHLGRVERIRADLARHPGLTVAGAAYDGVGIPACIASGARAATEVGTALASLRQ